eukprot:m.92074 g.92074  ORF g.92074 m.92074 type:complete len:213 (+) comp15060_c0_seq2:308-946(+)
MEEAAERKLFSLYQIWCTLKKMCFDRQYVVIPDELHMDFDTWKDSVWNRDRDAGSTREKLTFSECHKEDPTDKIFVFFPDEEEVGGATIKKYVTRMQELSIGRAIIVVQKKVAPLAKRDIGDLAPKYIIEQFFDSELLVNIMEHSLVPTHKLLSAEEKEVLLKRYNLSESQVPRMQLSDPVARYFGLSRGQVMKIVRRSETAGRYVTYRIVM